MYHSLFIKVTVKAAKKSITTLQIFPLFVTI